MNNTTKVGVGVGAVVAGLASYGLVTSEDPLPQYNRAEADQFVLRTLPNGYEVVVDERIKNLHPANSLPFQFSLHRYTNVVWQNHSEGGPCNGHLQLCWTGIVLNASYSIYHRPQVGGEYLWKRVTNTLGANRLMYALKDVHVYDLIYGDFRVTSP